MPDTVVRACFDKKSTHLCFYPGQNDANDGIYPLGPPKPIFLFKVNWFDGKWAKNISIINNLLIIPLFSYFFLYGRLTGSLSTLLVFVHYWYWYITDSGIRMFDRIHIFPNFISSIGFNYTIGGIYHIVWGIYSYLFLQLRITEPNKSPEKRSASTFAWGWNLALNTQRPP